MPELVLYDIRLQAQATLGKLSTNKSQASHIPRPMRVDHEVEELHVSSGIPDDVELMVGSLADDQLRHFSEYCSCQGEAQGEISSFCTKILAKGRGRNFDSVSPLNVLNSYPRQCCEKNNRKKIIPHYPL